MEQDDNAVRDVLAWVVQEFVESQNTKSERFFYADVDMKLPEGKAVKVTFEYVDAGALCDGGGIEGAPDLVIFDDERDSE